MVNKVPNDQPQPILRHHNDKRVRFDDGSRKEAQSENREMENDDHERDMAEAITDVRSNGVSLRKAAAKHGIPTMALSSRMSGVAP
jgi:hypothetical protein